MRHEEYRKPLLASIYYVLGWLTAVSTLIALGVLAEGASSPSPLLILFSGGCASLLLFAIGQLVELIGKTEYNTRELNHKMVYLIRGQFEADELLAKMAGEDEGADDEVEAGGNPASDK